MRWIFLSLFAANLGIFIWWQTAKSPALIPTPVYATPAGVASITLLSEARRSVAPSKEVEPQSIQADAPAAAPVLNPVESVSPVPAEQDTPGDVRALCVVVGPYENKELAQLALQKLHAKEIQAQLYEMELVMSAGFQVYLDGFETRALAKKRLDDLQGRGVDSFIIPKGEFINTIALGSFDQEAAARAQQEKLAALGIESKIRESKRPLAELWVALPPALGDQLPEPLRQILGVGAGEKKKEERQILCSTIASAKNIL